MRSVAYFDLQRTLSERLHEKCNTTRPRRPGSSASATRSHRYPFGQPRHTGCDRLLVHAPLLERIPLGQEGYRLSGLEMAATFAGYHFDQAALLKRCGLQIDLE